jgi:hypothetical protein
MENATQTFDMPTLRKPRAKAVSKLIAKAKRRKPVKADYLKRYAVSGVVFMSGLSAVLNVYSNTAHAGANVATVTFGVAIPLIVLWLFKVAALTARRGVSRDDRRIKWLAAGIGAAASGVLFLSVAHCAASLAMITGMSLWGTVPMAIAIDAGMVGCEVAALLDD